MAGAVYTYLGNADKSNQNASLSLAQGVVPLGQSGLFLPSEYQSLAGQGYDLVAGPAFSPAPQLTNPSVVPGAAGVLTGAYRWVVTFVTAAGETIGGPESIQISLTAQEGSLTEIPIGTPTSGVLARKIYRTAANGAPGTERYVATLNDNTTTSFTDDVADGSLGAPLPTVDNAGVIGESGTEPPSVEEDADIARV